MGLLKLASPELERMIIQQNGMVTTTPTPTQFLFPKSVSEEQEAYARGFVDALAELKKSDADSQTTQTSSTTTSVPAMVSQTQPLPQQQSYATLTTVTLPNASAKTQAQASFTTTTALPGSIIPSSTTTTSGVYVQQQPQLNGVVSQSNP